MIYEFAVEPELVAQWGLDIKDYRYFVDCFGLGRTRMVSEFPKLKTWRRDILRAAENAGDLQRQRVDALLGVLTERMVKRQGCAYDGNVAWLENAEKEHGRCPFHLILARDNPRRAGRVLAQSVIADPEDARWKIERTVSVSRTRDEFARAFAPMLSNCQEAHFIDPYFSPGDPDYRTSLEAFLDAMLDNRGGPLPGPVTVITSEKSKAAPFSSSHGDGDLQKLSRHIPRGMEVVLKRYKERGGGAELHNRYILTNLGGVFLGKGIDKGDSGHMDDVALLEKEHYLLRWKEYVEGPIAFDLVEEVSVSGRK